uniref:Uncharacterized protein n=1 Tax=Arundo donax TaxID=35708 RepID=A0A0A9BX21_ARUDO
MRWDEDERRQPNKRRTEEDWMDEDDLLGIEERVERDL